MIGVVIICHARLAPEFIAALEFISGRQEGMAAVDVTPSDNMEAIRAKVDAAMASVNSGAGVLLLTDLFGGTPANVGTTYLAPGKVELITGVNLPMLIKLTTARKAAVNVAELAETCKTYGQKNISLASEVLGQRRG